MSTRRKATTMTATDTRKSSPSTSEFPDPRRSRTYFEVDLRTLILRTYAILQLAHHVLGGSEEDLARRQGRSHGRGRIRRPGGSGLLRSRPLLPRHRQRHGE